MLIFYWGFASISMFMIDIGLQVFLYYIFLFFYWGNTGLIEWIRKCIQKFQKKKQSIFLISACMCILIFLYHVYKTPKICKTIKYNKPIFLPVYPVHANILCIFIFLSLRGLPIIDSLSHLIPLHLFLPCRCKPGEQDTISPNCQIRWRIFLFH